MAALPLTQQGLAETIAPGLPSELLANRPDLLAAEQPLRAAGAHIGAAGGAVFPRLRLTGLLGVASRALSGVVDVDGCTWPAGGTATSSAAPTVTRRRSKSSNGWPTGAWSAA